MIKLFNHAMTAALYITSMTFVWQVGQLQRDMKDFNRRMVWNIDAVRYQYSQDTEFAFKRGCNVGTEYPDEWRMDQTGFNQHSTVNYCNDEYTNKMEEYFLSQLPKLGVKDE